MNSSKKALSCAHRYYLQLTSFQIRNYAKLHREQDPEEVKNMPVFQYATKNTKRRRRLYMWGNTSFGALGNDNFVKPIRPHKYPCDSKWKPCRLTFADLHEVRDISCGYGFTVFAASNEENDFTLFGTGLNSDFQIGYHCVRKNQPLEIITQPVPIALPLFSMSTKVVKVGCGRAHTVAVTDKEGGDFEVCF